MKQDFEYFPRELNDLKVRGLSEEEAQVFLTILLKIESSEKEIESLNREWEEGLPFEGGMGFTEALTQLKVCVDGNDDKAIRTLRFSKTLPEKEVDEWIDKNKNEYFEENGEPNDKGGMDGLCCDFIQQFNVPKDKEGDACNYLETRKDIFE